MNTMRVPDAVRRQQEQMDAFDAELAAQPPGETPPATEPPAEPPPAPPSTPPTEVDWQQKFQTLQGKYNAEVPQLRSQIAELSDQVKNLTSQPAPTPEPTPAPAATPPPKLVTTEDTETYGDDLIDLIRRVAVETDAGEKAKLQGEIAELRKQMAATGEQVKEVQGNVVDDRRAKYFVALAEACPTYEAVDESEAFKTWLLEPDDFSGIVRNDLLQRAFHAFDAVQTAKIFNAYIAQATPSTPPPVAPTPSPQSELASQVSPGQARSSAPITPDTDGKKVWSIAEIDTYFKDRSRGDYRGRLDEALRIEAEIDRALAEGRVR